MVYPEVYRVRGHPHALTTAQASAEIGKPAGWMMAKNANGLQYQLRTQLIFLERRHKPYMRSEIRHDRSLDLPKASRRNLEVCDY
jgi:hypothetical protein